MNASFRYISIMCLWMLGKEMLKVVWRQTKTARLHFDDFADFYHKTRKTFVGHRWFYWIFHRSNKSMSLKFHVPVFEDVTKTV